MELVEAIDYLFHRWESCQGVAFLDLLRPHLSKLPKVLSEWGIAVDDCELKLIITFCFDCV